MTPNAPMQQWQQLVASAVLGADRAGGRLPTLEGAPARLLPPQPRDGAGQLLEAAAILSVYERAGRRPLAEGGSKSTCCIDDERSACSFRAGQHLARILLGEFTFLLDEWCALAAAGGVRAPDELLPALLERFAGNREPIGAAGAAVLGRRGTWLAALNPDWNGVVQAAANDPQTIWATGEKRQRLALLRQLRAMDADRGRALLAQTWDKESGDDRAEIVQTLVTGLSVRDEAFLEAALDDGRKPVRQAAAELLARLPSSAFSQRMAARATAHVALTLQKRLLRGSKLQINVSLPETSDKSALRDGIESKRSGTMGERVHALSQIVAAAPLAVWKASGATPAEIVAVGRDSDWRESLLRGWARAVAREGDAAWAAPLLMESLTSSAEPDIEISRLLIEGLDGAARERVLMSALQDSAVDLSRSVALLEYCAHAWSEDFSRGALRALQRYFGTATAYSAHALRVSIKQQISKYFSPVIAGEVDAGWNRTESNWHKGDEEMATALAATLTFRRDMQEELGR